MKKLTRRQQLAKLKRRDLRMVFAYQKWVSNPAGQPPPCVIYRRNKLTPGRFYQILSKYGIERRNGK